MKSLTAVLLIAVAVSAVDHTRVGFWVERFTSPAVLAHILKGAHLTGQPFFTVLTGYSLKDSR